LTSGAQRLTLQGMSKPRFLIQKKLGVFCLLIALGLPNLKAADAPAPTAPTAPDNAGSNDALRAYLQLQEQMHDTQLAIERNRQDEQAAAAQDSITLSNRLQAIEQAMSQQRANELADSQRTNRLLVAGIGLFAAIGFAATLVMGYFQWRAVNRLAEISTSLSTGRMAALPALGFSEREALTNGSAEQPNTRLIGLIQHLEKRIAELEHMGTLPLKEMPLSGNGAAHAAHAAPEESIPVAVPDRAGKIASLLEHGQTLLNSDQPEEAITSFNEVLALEPNNAEAFVKKGTALEKMRQPQEALACYDEAIRADGSLTIAYLHKGGLCSRLERYAEAMECYEKALHTQEKKRAA
jgi:tetratricopeptide (TPR) repeat protein